MISSRNKSTPDGIKLWKREFWAEVPVWSRYVTWPVTRVVRTSTTNSTCTPRYAGGMARGAERGGARSEWVSRGDDDDYDGVVRFFYLLIVHELVETAWFRARPRLSGDFWVHRITYTVYFNSKLTVVNDWVERGMMTALMISFLFFFILN